MREENTARELNCAALTQFELSKDILNKLYKFNLKPTAKLVLLYLCDCYNAKHRTMFPKQRTIADKLGISEASVIRAIQELHKEGLIISERQHTNKYKFTSKIVSEPSNFVQNNMQVDNLQKERKETSNLQVEYKEQIKETNKTTNVNDYKILRDYAERHAKSSVEGYIRRLKETGADKRIISEYKTKQRIKKRAELEFQKTQELIRQHEEWARTAVPPTKEFLAVMERLRPKK